MPTTVAVVQSNIDGGYDLEIKAGLLHREIKSIKLYRVTDVSFNRGFLDLIFGRGNVEIRSTDPKMNNLRITKIKRAKDFASYIESCVHSERNKAGVKYNEINVLS